MVSLCVLGGCTAEAPPRTALDPGSRDTLAFSGELLPAGKVPEVTIGILDGDESQVFGEIRDLAVLPDGSVLVLDGQDAVASLELHAMPSAVEAAAVAGPCDSSSVSGATPTSSSTSDAASAGTSWRI